MTKNSKINNRLARILMQTTAAILISGTAITSSVNIAYAQEAEEGRQFGAKAGGIVNEALQLINSEQHSAAIAELTKALGLADINPYEKSTIYQMRGMSYYELKQMGAAIGDLENAINAGGFFPNEVSALRVNIAQLYISEGQYSKGAQMLENWANSGGTLKASHIELLYQAWVQAENYSRALPWAEKWFNAASPKLRKHFDVLNFLYNNLGMQGRQADIVKQMINRWPEDTQLWNTWISMLANGGREEEAFEVSKMLYLGGAYTQEQDIMRVVQYLGLYEMPYQAAQILEREMNTGRVQQTSLNLEMLSNLFRQAREYKRAIPILERAARKSGKAKMYGSWGEALYNEGQCTKAEAALQEAMKIGFSRGKAWSFIANCHYNTASAAPRLNCAWPAEKINGSERVKFWNKAKEAFSNVPSGSRDKKGANTWTRFINGERQGFEDRCEFQRNVEEETCMIAIRLEYDELFITGKFELENDKCMKFKPKYDGLYRIKTTDG